MEEKILIVDDEPHIRRILKYLLEQQGYEVLDAADGKEAIDIADSNLPDLLLLDLMMPRMDGFEVCKRLRENFRTSQIPIIMVTAKGEVDDKVRGLEGGANDYLTKPYDNKELLARVRNVLDWSKSQRQANPLTGLPGNQAIEKELQQRIDSGLPFAFMYLDIDNFKGYNDHYGYQRGDEVIRFMADLMRASVESAGSPNDFIGHIGGDDFCLIAAVDYAEDLGNIMAERFGEGILALIDEDDRERGYLVVRSRQGGLSQANFPSITIALVIDDSGSFEHWAMVSDAAVELKSYGKSMEGNVVVKERRSSKEQLATNTTTPDSTSS